MSTLVSLPRSVLITKSDANAPRASSTASISVIQYASSDSESSKQVPISISETVSFPKHPAEMTYATFCDADSVVTLDRETLRHWHIDRGSSEPNLSDGFVFGKVPNLRVGKPDPLSAGRFIAASGANVNVFDWRQASPSESALQISSAHPAPIQDLDINPNKPHHLVTAGSDGSIRFWDLRRPDAPILMLLGHTHWVESVAYNHHHDQLVLSGSSDCTVRLWSAQSVSSAPSIGLDTSESPNRVIEIIKDHEDSVYQACWSASDAWVFASLSYDGRVVVNNVNQTEKYKILL
uniref:EIPR1-like beta-propeller domain-containing protein n=1 Tax=Spongospora subterranea TaxID=70186 RepID=A0A0H5QJ88_9EUKA|eukprot:CRZ02175.1 hypothetical protein [Spongospora subterranea]